MREQANLLPRQGTASYWMDLALITLFLGGLFFILLGSRPLFVPDEGRYAEIAREMVTSGDYVTPYLNQIKYFEKPILFYWLGAAAFKIGGISIWSIRCINALLGLLGCLFTYVAVRQWYDRPTAFLSAMVLGTSALYFVMAHMVSLDLPVTVFLMCCLYAFLTGISQPRGLPRRLCFWSAAAAAALAVLTKGLIGLVFPVLIISVWLTVAQQWRRLFPLYLPSCLGIFLLIALPWHLLVGYRNPEFFYFYFIEQHFLRYTTPDVGHYQPVWFFIPTFILGLFPWVVFLPQTITSSLSTWLTPKQPGSHTAKTDAFLWLWALLIFIFFSFSKSKLIPYILPVYPPIAILISRQLVSYLNKDRRSALKISYLCLLACSAALVYGFYHFTHHTVLMDSAQASLPLCAAALFSLIGAIVSYRLIDRHLMNAFYVTMVSTGCFLVLLVAAMPAIDTRTIQPLTTILKPLLKPQDDVITYDKYYQDLPFYLERRITILNWKNELSYGMQHQDTSAWMINNNTFWQRWHSAQQVFVFMSSDDFQGLTQLYPHETFYILGQTPTNILLSNQQHP